MTLLLTEHLLYCVYHIISIMIFCGCRHLETRIGMTDKELRKLRRQDLLELLVEQSKETGRLATELGEKEAELTEAQEGNERLKGKLDEKDALIEKLKSRLDEKDAQMAEETARSEEILARLKGKLDEKDALIEKLRARLDSRDEKIEMLEAEAVKLRSERWKEMKDSGLPPELLSTIKTLMQ